MVGLLPEGVIESDRPSNLYLHSNIVAFCHNNCKSALDQLKNCANVRIISDEEYVLKDIATHLIIKENDGHSFETLLGILRGLFIVTESCMYLKNSIVLYTYKNLSKLFQFVF